MAFSGFSPGEAEGLRRAMSRKRSAEAIEAHHRGFVEGAMAKWPDVDEALAERVWSMVVGFSGFGFPKAHGAAFGLLAYQSTWLRVHYGPEFLCSLLDEQPMGFYPPDALVHEAQRRGIEILPPDVNASAVGCTVVDVPAEVLPFRPRPAREPALAAAPPPPAAPPTPLPVRTAAAPARAAVRLGLGYVLGVRGDEVAALVEARESGGPFRSLDDLAARAGAGRPALAQLAWSGACDALAGGRRPGAVAPGRRCARPRGGGGGDPALARARAARGAGARAPRRLGRDDRRLRDDRPHRRPPSAAPAARGPVGAGIATSADLGDLPHGAHVRVGGIVVARQRPGDRQGRRLPAARGRDGDGERHHPAEDLRARPPRPSAPSRSWWSRACSSASRRPGARINLLVKRIAPLDAPDLLSRRPHAQVKDFSMLDARELARIALEQPRVAAAAAGGATAAHVRPAAPAGAAGRRRARRAGARRAAPVSAAPASRPAASGAPAPARPTTAALPSMPAADRSAGAPGTPGPHPHEPAEPDEPLPASGTGAEDFRAVAPPIMSFAQGRRR